MTEDEKYEIATLASEVRRTWRVYEAHMLMNSPTDPVEAEKAFIAYKIAETEWLEAEARLRAAQRRVANS